MNKVSVFSLALLSLLASSFINPDSAMASGSKSVVRGNSATMSWTVSNAPSCSGTTAYPALADNVKSSWEGSIKAGSGSLTFPSITAAPGSYIFTCTNYDTTPNPTDSATLVVTDCLSPQTWSGSACVSPPATPGGFTVTTGGTCGGSITLNWSASAGATSYEVSRDSGAWTSVGNVTTWTDTGLAVGSNHSYRVRAVTGSLQSTASGSLSANASAACVVAPGTPTGLSVSPSACGNNWLNLSWNATANATGYKVERDNSGTWTDVGNVTSWSDTGLVLGSSHSYKVLAYNSVGQSSPTGSVSNTVASACVVTAPATPTGLTVTPSACNNNWLNVGWNASASATGYRVERDGSGTWIDVGNVTGWSDTGLVLGSTHSYKVLAYNTGGSSAPTASVSNTVANACGTASGTITPNSCTIASGASSCSMNIAWTSSGTVGTVTVQRGYSPFGTVATGVNGSQSFSFTPPGTYPFRLYDGVTLLNTANFTASCAAGTVWSNGVCTPSSGGPGTFTAVTGACATPGSVNLSWPAQGGVTDYKLSRDGGAWFSVGNVTSYVDTVAAGSAHTYRLQTSSNKVVLSSGSSWTVPAGWDSTNNSIETIGAGGGTNFSYGGGGGGAYSSITNLTLTPGSSVNYAIGAGSNATNGGDTYFCNTTTNCASIAGTAVKVGAKGGKTNSSGSGGAGGAAASGIGTTKVSGGAGGGGVQSGCCSIAGGGGGGAGGPGGVGGTGGWGYVDTDTGNEWSGGGGAYNNGGAGQAGGPGLAMGTVAAGGSPNGSNGMYSTSGNPISGGPGGGWSTVGIQGALGITRGSGGGGMANQAGGAGLIIINYAGGFDSVPSVNASNSCAVVPGASLTADKTELYSPTVSTTLHWSCTNSSSCTLNGVNQSNCNTGGNPTVGPFPAPSTQSNQLLCYASADWSGTPATALLTLNVHTADVTLTANPTRVKSGGQSVISWELNGVKSCTVKKNGVSWPSPASLADFTKSSSYTQTDITGQSTFVFSCLNNDNTPIMDASVTVNILPVFQVF